MAIDDARMEYRADGAHPVVNVAFGTAQAQGGFTTHGDAMFSLSTLQASIFEIADLVRLATPEHLVHESVIIGTLITGRLLFKPIPVILEYLFTDIPRWSGFCFHDHDYTSYLLV